MVAKILDATDSSSTMRLTTIYFVTNFQFTILIISLRGSCDDYETDFINVHLLPFPSYFGTEKLHMADTSSITSLKIIYILPLT